MRVARISTFFLTLCFLTGCPDSSNPPNLPALPSTANPYLKATGSNVIPVQVGGSGLCATHGNINTPCVSVTLCVPGTNTCQTISDILLDTGSVGLRLFSSVVTLPLVQAKNSSGAGITECAQFGTGSDWGPVVQSDVILGQEPAVNVPIQLINRNYATATAACSQADTSPEQSGFNGILGVGLFTNDCGSACALDSTTQTYFACTGTTCTPTAYAQSLQLQNPVAHLNEDGNGLVVALQQVGFGGANSATGVLILGIGTKANNIPIGVTAYLTDRNGNFTAHLAAKDLSRSFLDTGSNGYFFPNVLNLPLCALNGPAPGLYCPPVSQAFTIRNSSADGSKQALIPFTISNGESFSVSSALASSDMGGPAISGMNGFDFGLPFFYGRAVFYGIEGRSSPLGSSGSGNSLFVAY